MHIAIIAAEPGIGRVLSAECAARGMETVTLREPEDLDRETLLSSYDVIVDCGLSETKSARLACRLRELGDTTDRRLIVLGSAGSLYRDGCRTERMSQTDRTLRDSAAALQLPELYGDAVTCFLPAVSFGQEEKASGAYLVGRDVRILNSMGESRLSYADFAAAIADEIERPHFRGRCFTAVSDTSALPPEPDNNLIDLSKKYMLTRRGSYFGIASDVTVRGTGTAYQRARLYIATRRSTPTGIPDIGNDLVRLTPMYQGREIGCAVRMTPTELVMTTAYGEIRACMADTHLLLIRGENGLSLALHNRMHPGEVMKRRGGAAWEGVFRWRCTLVLNPLGGSLDMRTEWRCAEMTCPSFRGVIEPDADGRFLLAVDESPYAGVLRGEYPDYAAGLADVTEDWERFLRDIPPLDPALERVRLEAAWSLWAFQVEPFGFVKRPHMFMAAANVASSWQMSHNAAALCGNMPLAMDLMENMIDGIGELGQLPDFVSDGRNMAQGLHPPVQGWAMKWIMRKHDIGKEVPHDRLARLYDGFARWAEWFLLARDGDRDGLPQYDNGDEIGFDDCSPFENRLDLVMPDLSAYLVLIYDVLSDIAEILDRPAEHENWKERADGLTQRIVDTFWNGERFVGIENYTHEPVATDSLVYYLPIILGRRLPQEIIDKMTEDLMKEGEFLTPSGLCIEKLDSDFFRLSGMSRGWVLPPSNLMILTGMYSAGKTKEAKTIARRYCDACAKWGLSMLLDPVRGTPNGFACTWPACTFLVLADMACNM